MTAMTIFDFKYYSQEKHLMLLSNFIFNKAPGPVATNQPHIWNSGSVNLGDHALKCPQNSTILLHPLRYILFEKEHREYLGVSGNMISKLLILFTVYKFIV